MGLLILLHAVGFISWHTSWASWVSLLTPIHLLISFWLLVWFAGGGQTLKFRLLLVYLLGLGVEILGVHTGYPSEPTSTWRGSGRPFGIRLG